MYVQDLKFMYGTYLCVCMYSMYICMYVCMYVSFLNSSAQYGSSDPIAILHMVNSNHTAIFVCRVGVPIRLT
jgi:hypothetical protein